MTREEWAARLPLIQAFVEGKTVEYNFVDGWTELNGTTFAADPSEYRIKPGPKEEWTVYQAYKAGARIECLQHCGDWEELESPCFDLPRDRYRIKPEPEQPKQESRFNSLLTVGAIVEHRNYAGEMLYESRPESVSGGNTDDDPVNHPSHYQHKSGLEAHDFSEHLPHLAGAAFEYVWRADSKGDPIKDLEKAAYCLRRIAKGSNKPSRPSVFEVIKDMTWVTGECLRMICANSYIRAAEIIEDEIARRKAVKA